jgi:hypothetical protein
LTLTPTRRKLPPGYQLKIELLKLHSVEQTSETPGNLFTRNRNVSSKEEMLILITIMSTKFILMNLSRLRAPFGTKYGRRTALTVRLSTRQSATSPFPLSERLKTIAGEQEMSLMD